MIKHKISDFKFLIIKKIYISFTKKKKKKKKKENLLLMIPPFTYIFVVVYD